MKTIPIILSLLILVLGCNENEIKAQKKIHPIDNNYTAYAGLLDKYVENGRVNYTELKRNSSILDSLVTSLEGSDLNGLNEKQKIAFYINAYNLITIKSIVDAYPVNSIKNINGAWDKKKWNVADNKLTLNDIEHEILRKEFSEPKIHFAIVCASIGCPPLLSKPFLADSLEKQLEMVSNNFVSDENYNILDIEFKSAKLSSIFDWFGEDFVDQYYDSSNFNHLSKKENASLNFIISQFPPDEQEKLKQLEFKINYLDYDWSLNDQK